MEDSERRGVGTKPERQRGGGDDCERGTPAEDTQPIRHVLREIVHPRHAPFVAALLLEHGNVAQRPSRRPARIVERHAVLDVLGDEQIEVKGELACDLGIHGVLPDKGSDALIRDAKESGDGHVGRTLRPA